MGYAETNQGDLNPHFSLLPSGGCKHPYILRYRNGWLIRSETIFD